MPTIHTITALKPPSTLQTPRSARKPPKVQVYQNNQLADFREKDKIINFVDITQSQTPANYLFRKTSECVILLSLVFVLQKDFQKYLVLWKLIKIWMCSWGGVEILFHCPKRLFDILIIMFKFLLSYFGQSLRCYIYPVNFLQDLCVFTPLIQCSMTLFASWPLALNSSLFVIAKLKCSSRTIFGIASNLGY